MNQNSNSSQNDFAPIVKEINTNTSQNPEVKIPNHELWESIQQAERKELEHHESIEDLMKDLRS